MLNDAQRIAVRFNFHKIAPLGIGDQDYRRIAMALDLSEDDVKSFCAACEGEVQRAAQCMAEKLPSQAKNARICFIGDSITSERTSYMRILQRCLEKYPGVQTLDCAVSGWKTSDVIFEYEDRVIPFQPTHIHMMIGTNDARNAYPGEDGSTIGTAGYRRNMERLIRYALSLNAKLIVTTVPPAAPAPAAAANGNYPHWESRTFNAVLRELAQAYPFVLNDMEDALEGRLDAIIDNFDNVHLNAQGQRSIAECLLPLLLQEIEA